MMAFRILLATMLAVLVVYTGVTIANHGLNLFPIFFGDIAKMGWPGQFNADFLGMLTLSGLWTAWRNRFSAGGIVLGLLAFNLGAPFLCAYLLVLTAQAKGDMREVLVGRERVRA
jgi:hypothetical protein